MGHSKQLNGIFRITILSVVLFTGALSTPSFTSQSNEIIDDSIEEFTFGLVQLSSAANHARTSVSYAGGPTPPIPPFEAALFTTEASGPCSITALNGVGLQFATFSTSLQEFPTETTSFVVISSGDAADSPGAAADFLSTSLGGTSSASYPFPTESPAGSTSNDIAKLVVECTIPIGAQSISFDWIFATEENPFFLTAFPDYFRVLESDTELGYKWIADPPPIIKYLKEGTKITWEGKNLKAIDAYKFEW